MRAVLINVDEKGTFYASHGQSWGHLGLLLVGTALEQEGFQVQLWDELIMGDAPLEDLIQPGDIVGFSLVVTGVTRGIELAKKAKYLGAKFVVAGNDQASFRSAQLLNMGIDHIFKGDDLAQIRIGFNSMRNGHLPEGTTAPQKEYFIVPDLNLFPKIHWEKVWENRRQINGFEYSNPESLRNSLILFCGGCSRGLNICPYCSIGEVSNIRKPPQREYLKKVVDAYKKFGINDFFNVTDSFYEMSSVIKSLGELGITFPNLTLYARAWGLSHRPENTDLLLSLVESGGILKFNIGFDSGDDWVLKHSIKKGHGIKENLDAVALLKKSGVHLHCSFIFGAPGETRESCEGTMEFIQFIIDELGPQLIEVEPDIWWLNFGAPCSRIFYDYETACGYAGLAGKSIAKNEWQWEFARHQDALFVPWSAEQAWYKYFTRIAVEEAQGYVEQTMAMGQRHQIITGRGFGGHPFGDIGDDSS